MPWRKVYDDSLSMEEKGQRAYEVCVLYWFVNRDSGLVADLLYILSSDLGYVL